MSPSLQPFPVLAAAAQLAPVFGDVEGNRARAAEAVADAAAAGARLIVLPELCTTGYVFRDESEARELGEPADGPTLAHWRALAADHAITIAGGFCELDEEGRTRNSGAIVEPGGQAAVYRKAHLWNREQLTFVAGSEPPPVLETPAGRVGLAICYDAFFPETMRALALGGADIIAVPMNSPVTGERPAPAVSEILLARAAAHVNRVYVVQADRAGRERGVDWSQASAICDPDGMVVCGPAPGPRLLLGECDLARARDKSIGPLNDVLADRRPDLYAAIPAPAAASASAPAAAPRPREAIS